MLDRVDLCGTGGRVTGSVDARFLVLLDYPSGVRGNPGGLGVVLRGNKKKMKRSVSPTRSLRRCKAPAEQRSSFANCIMEEPQGRGSLKGL